MKFLHNHKTCYYAYFLLSIFLLITASNAQNNKIPSSKTSSKNVTISANLSLIDTIKRSLQDNSLRAGFEPFYYITNLFIDELFVFHLPAEFVFNPIEATKNLARQVIGHTKHGDWKHVASLPFKYYTSLAVFVIITLILVVLIPVTGFLVMSYRCCCKRKLNPFDLKSDSIKRKLNAVFLFLLLCVILIATVILFFTNQNSTMAIRKIPSVYRNEVAQANQYLSKDIPDFLNRSNDHIEFFKENLTTLFDKTLVKTFNSTFESLNISESAISNFNRDVAKELNSISSIYKTLFDASKNSSLISKLNLLASLPSGDDAELNESINKLNGFVVSIKSEYEFLKDLNSTDFNFENLMVLLTKDFTRESKQKFKEAINQLFERATNVNKRNTDFIIFNQLPKISQAINSTNPDIEKGLGLLTHYYDYFYYFIMGVSSFMLLLFVLYSFGLTGMCARRKHHNYKQSCDRGTSAKCFLSGVGLFFLFSWAILVLCIALYVPGILARQLVCSPAINAEHNQVRSSYQRILNNQLSTPNFNDSIFHALSQVNFTRLLNECQNTNHSVEIDNILFKILNNIISDESVRIKSESDLTQLIKSINIPPQNTLVEKLEEFFNKFQKLFVDNKLNDILKDSKTLLESLKESLDNKAESASDFVTKDDLMELERLIEHTEKLAQKKNVIQELNAQFVIIKDKLKSLSDANKFTMQLNQTIHTYSLNELNNMIVQSSKSFIKTAPSCKIISDAYSSLLLTGCYEILDNLNTYWFTLFFLVLIHLLVAAFSIGQADLFRKSYAYDELLSDDRHQDDNKQPIYGHDQYEVYQTRNLNGNTPIDAYEMHGYSKNNGKIVKNYGRTPPQYKNLK